MNTQEFTDFSDETQEGLIELITARSIKFIALVGIFINMITYFALSDSLYIFPRLFPPAMELFFIGQIIWGNEIELKFKLKLLIASLFITGCYLLMPGLLDMASLWFVLSIIYALFLNTGKEALYLFFASLLTVVSAGLAIMSKSTIIPLKYNFEPCQFACVSVRILHFFMSGLSYI